MACRQKRISRFTISKSLDILLVLGFHVGSTPDLGKLRSRQIRSCALGKSEVALLANQKLRSWQIKSCAFGKSNLNSAAVSSFFTSNTLRSTAVAHNSETKRRCSFSAHCTLYIAHNSWDKKALRGRLVAHFGRAIASNCPLTELRPSSIWASFQHDDDE